MILNSYIYIPVSDLEVASRWYNEMLDFHVVYKDSLYYDMRTSTGVKLMLLPNDGTITSQMRFPTGMQPTYGFCVNDFDAIRTHFERKNVKIGEVFDYFGRSFSFFDPDGNKIEIWEDYAYQV